MLLWWADVSQAQARAWEVEHGLNQSTVPTPLSHCLHYHCALSCIFVSLLFPSSFSFISCSHFFLSSHNDFFDLISILLFPPCAVSILFCALISAPLTSPLSSPHSSPFFFHFPSRTPLLHSVCPCPCRSLPTPFPSYLPSVSARLMLITLREQGVGEDVAVLLAHQEAIDALRGTVEARISALEGQLEQTKGELEESQRQLEETRKGLEETRGELEEAKRLRAMDLEFLRRQEEEKEREVLNVKGDLLAVKGELLGELVIVKEGLVAVKGELVAVRGELVTVKGQLLEQKECVWKLEKERAAMEAEVSGLRLAAGGQLAAVELCQAQTPRHEELDVEDQLRTSKGDVKSFWQVCKSAG
ncbi:unnamed protein product [Closterium sp. NIES-64]|nr:unnamed protein product [Closterium sp. NIES-64]